MYTIFSCYLQACVVKREFAKAEVLIKYAVNFARLVVKQKDSLIKLWQIICIIAGSLPHCKTYLTKVFIKASSLFVSVFPMVSHLDCSIGGMLYLKFAVWLAKSLVLWPLTNVVILSIST